MRLLVVDDDTEITTILEQALRPIYAVDVVNTAADALYRAQLNPYDAIVLDITLPDIPGTEVCSTLRERNITAPILMLTGMDTVDSKIRALDAGADDYLVKPFSVSELQARLRALLRRLPDPLPNVLTLADLQLDTVHRSVQRAGQCITLRKKEFDLLEYLLRNKNRTLTRSMILEHVWDERADLYSNTVDVHINHVRDKIDKKFSPKLIRTINGVGYVLTPNQVKV